MSLPGLRGLPGLTSRLDAELRLKILLSLGLTAFFLGGYFLLQRLVVFPVTRLAPGPVDRWVEFDPRWVWVYQSLYLLLPVPWLAETRRQLLTYARGFVLLALAGFAVFLLCPVAGPRPEGVEASGLYRLLILYDRNLNAFPSLHIGLAVYTSLFGLWLLGRSAVPWRLRLLCGALAGVWTVAIAYSTLAVKQHYAVDLPAGALLAWLAHRGSLLQAPDQALTNR